MEGPLVNVVDLVVIAIVVISGLFALVRGFIHEFLSLGSWIGAGVATYYGIDHAIPVARGLTDVQPLADIGAGVAVFLVVLILLSILTRFLARRVRHSAFGPLDRSLGLLFGLARGVVLVAIAGLVTAWTYQDEDYPDWIAKARTLPIIVASAATLYDLLPEGMRPEELPSGLEPAESLDDITFGDFDVPAPKAAAKPEQSGYNTGTRKGLENLFRQSQ